MEPNYFENWDYFVSVLLKDQCAFSPFEVKHDSIMLLFPGTKAEFMKIQKIRVISVLATSATGYRG